MYKWKNILFLVDDVTRLELVLDHGINIDGKSQVNAFMSGIKSDDAIMTSIKTQIAADPSINADLEEAILKTKDLRRTLTPTMSSTSRYRGNRRISATLCK